MPASELMHMNFLMRLRREITHNLCKTYSDRGICAMAPPRKRTKLSTDQPAEILFDVTARQDYLTGFHKRKVARKEHAKETAIKRAKEEKVQERRQVSDELGSLRALTS